jgi:hypothetical protein
MAQQRTLRSFAPIQGIASDTRFTLSPGDDDNITVKGGIGQEGDIVLVEAMSDTGAYKEMEDLNGHGMRVYKRQRFIAVLGNRESSKYLVGGLPEGGLPILENGDTNVHLLASGGIMGICKESPHYMGPPSVFRCLGLLKRNDVSINTQDSINYVRGELTQSKPILLVAGTATDVGKTTVTSNIIQRLVYDHGLKVAATKLSGTGCLEDTLSHRDAGATITLDFPDVGLPSTYIAPEKYMLGIRTLLTKANEQQPDIIVSELGGDIIWGNIPTLLTALDIMQHVIGLVLVPFDVLGAIGTMQLLREWNVTVPVYIINSPFRNNLALQMRIKRYLNTDSYSSVDASDLDRLVKTLLQNIK